MGFIFYLTLAFIHLAVSLVDLGIVLILVRLASQCIPSSRLRLIDSAAAPIVDPTLTLVGKWFTKNGHLPLRQSALFAFCLTGLFVVRLLLVLLLGLAVNGQ